MVYEPNDEPKSTGELGGKKKSMYSIFSFFQLLNLNKFK